MNTIENQLAQLRLRGIHSTTKAMVETWQHHELPFGEGLEVLLQAEEDLFMASISKVPSLPKSFQAGLCNIAIRHCATYHYLGK